MTLSTKCAADSVIRRAPHLPLTPRAMNSHHLLRNSYPKTVALLLPLFLCVRENPFRKNFTEDLMTFISMAINDALNHLIIVEPSIP